MVTAEDIDAVLPQTQCTKCGYAGCLPYAQALATGQAQINRCPPGGETGVARLAALLGRPALPLDPQCGQEGPRMVALIDEARCIGCALCLQACPTDAIVGAAKQMHTVLTEHCTGCELCLPPCPVDCIDMLTLAHLAQRGSGVAHREADTPVAGHAARWRARYARHKERLERVPRRRQLAAEARDRPTAAPSAESDVERKRAAVRAAIQRARARAADNR
jgi:electron transport complex protein RnfB